MSTVSENPIDAISRRSGGRSARDYILKDSRTVPKILLDTSHEDLGVGGVSVDRYFSQEWHDAEVEKVWHKAWQMACHVEELRNVGDTYVYDIPGRSVLLVRTAPDTVKGYHNSCLHRGTRLRSEPGKVGALRCPFHAWTWTLDGKLHHIPYDWDFEHVDAESYSLPEVRVGVWDAFVFVTFDDDQPPLETYLGDFIEHFSPWPLRKRQLLVHTETIVPCNWKIGIEAFIEGYHVPGTHPQFVPMSGEGDSEYDVYPGQPIFNRMINPSTVPSSYLGYEHGDEGVLRCMAETLGIKDANGEPLAVPRGSSAREVMADHVRAAIAERGVDAEAISDSEVLDALQYYVFPDLLLFAGYALPVGYRFRPSGDDPDHCWMDVYVWGHGETPAPIGDEERPSVRAITIPEGESLTTVRQLGPYGAVFDQDLVNMPLVHKGLKTTTRKEITLAAYQENRIRHYHQTLESWLRDES